MAAPSEKELKLLPEFRKCVEDLKLYGDQNSDMYLLRWLRAREHKLDQAEDMLRKHLVWRKENEIDHIKSFKPPAHFAKDLPYDIVGLDPDNCPIVIFPIGSWDFKAIVNAGETEEFNKFKDRLHEGFLERMKGKVTREGVPTTQIISIVDCAHASFRQTSFSVLNLLKEDTSRFEANYPELLKVTHIINVPWFFSIAMNFLRPFMSTRTIEKFNIYSSDPTKWMPVLKDIVGEKNLPTIYGGANADSVLNLVATE